MQILPCYNRESCFGVTIWPTVCAHKCDEKHLHLWPMILRKKIHCKSTKNEWTSYHNQNRVIKFCIDAGFLTTVDVGQYFMTKDTEEFSQFTEPVTCREYTLPRDEKSSDPKGWIRGIPKFGPYWKSQPVACKVKMEWKLELNLWTKTILTRGLEFLMTWTSWSRTWSTTKSTTTTSRRPLRRSRTNSRWKRMYLHSQSDQRLKQNHEDLLLLAHLQELHPSGKESGLMLSQELIRISLSQCEKKNDYSSSSWSFTRRRWSDWTLETKRWSSERIWELSALVWWNVEEWNDRRRRQQEKISILYWLVRTRNSLPPSSSRSFRTQSHWSLTTGQCFNYERFLRVHSSYRMCNQFTLHHNSGLIPVRTTKFEQKTDGILHVWSHEEGT